MGDTPWAAAAHGRMDGLMDDGRISVSPSLFVSSLSPSLSRATLSLSFDPSCFGLVLQYIYTQEAPGLSLGCPGEELGRGAQHTLEGGRRRSGGWAEAVSRWDG